MSLNCSTANVSDFGPFKIYAENAYGGIPNALIFNTCIAIPSVVFFLTMTKLTWNAVINNSNISTTGFFSFPEENWGRIRNISTFCGFLKKTFIVKHEEILEICGRDAATYLKFEECLLIYMIGVVIVSIGIILPLNFYGDHLQVKLTHFEASTMANIGKKSPTLWVHFTVPFLYYIGAVFAMYYFSKIVDFQAERISNLTLMVEHVPMCTKEELYDYFYNVVPGVTDIERISFTYDTYQLEHLSRRLMATQNALGYCIDHSDVKLYKSRCCCCWTSDINAKEFYMEELYNLTKEYEEAKARVLAIPLGVVFVTFGSFTSSNKVLDAFRRFRCTRFEPPKKCKRLRPKDWVVSYAPPPNDIQWNNLNQPRTCLNMRNIGVNLLVFLGVLLLSTPTHAAEHLEQILSNAGVPLYYLSPLLLMICCIGLPALVTLSSTFLGFYTHSEEGESTMLKTYFYLLFMVIFMPTFGFQTGVQAITFLINPEDTTEYYRWKCFFLPEAVAFFIRYLIFTAIAGCSFELVQLPKIINYFAKMCFARSRADMPSIRQAVHSEFAFGENYAGTILMFAMTITFSVICPLITPFGLLFLVIRLYVDRYMFLYMYKKNESINQNVHIVAIKMAVMAPILQLMLLIVYVVIQDQSGIRMIYTLLLSTLAAGSYSAIYMHDYFKEFYPVDSTKKVIEEHEEEALRNYSYGIENNMIK